MNQLQQLEHDLNNLSLAIERGLICTDLPAAARFALSLEARLNAAGLQTSHEQDAVERSKVFIAKFR